MPPRNIDLDPTTLVTGEDLQPGIQPVASEATHEQKRPPMKIVWRNVIWMSYLHLAALYGIYCIFYCHPLTLIWGEYSSYIFILFYVTISIIQNTPLYSKQKVSQS